MSQLASQPETPARILFVNYFGTVGGGQIHLLTLLDGLNRQKFEPHVVCCQEGAFCERLRQRGLNPILIPFGKAKRRYVWVTYPAIKKFARLLKTLRPGLVHVSGWQDAKLAAGPCRRAHVPMVWLVAP